MKSQSEQEEPVVFNRTNEHMKRKSGQAASMFLYPARRKIRFNAAAVDLMKLKAGQRIDFLLFKNKEWCVINSEQGDGYVMSSDSKKRGHESMTINCTHFIRHFLESVKQPPINCSFYLSPDTRKYRDEEVTAILTDKTVEQILKSSK